MADDSHETTPKRVIDERRIDVSRFMDLYDQARHGLIDRDPELMLTRWHVAVWAMYREVQRYRWQPNLEEVWYEAIEHLEIDDQPVSLEMLDSVQFQTAQQTTTRYNPTTNNTEPVTDDKPTRFTAEELRHITAKLDECYHELGFDAAPKTVLKTYGTRGENPEFAPPDEYVDIEHLAEHADSEA
jgi:hypothetical protein